jgi:Fe-S-cluster-containing hydrogenase component 2
MRRFCHILFFGSLFVGFCGAAGAQQRFPPPDFEGGYKLPLTTVPPARQQLYEYLDVAVLLAALLLGSYLSLQKRSRRGIFCLMVFSLVYFGFWRKGCVCPIGAIQNIALAFFEPAYAIPTTVIIFFLLPLFFTLFFGRTFCAAVCPLGAIQDVVLVRPLQLPGWLEHTLGLLGYVYLGGAVLFAATGSAFIICQYDPFVSFFRMSGSFEMLVLGGSFLVVGLFVGRAYCRFLCPYGVIMRVLSKFSKWRITITPKDCIQCRLCEESCPFGAIQKPATAPQPHDYRAGKIKLITLFVLAPIIVTVAGRLGMELAEPFSRMHERVRLADRIHMEETGRIEGTDDASEAFRATGGSIAQLYSEAGQIADEFVWGSMLFGGFVGLVVAGKLIGLTVRRSRKDYEADQGRCLACGRCFDYCPVGRAERKVEH